MARTAEAAGNAAEALEYYNRVLEIDPTLSEAWVGKGKAAAWQSSLASLRLTEMVVAFQHAIGTAPEHEKQQTTVRCVEEINKLVATVYGMARKHLLEHVALPDVWPQYIARNSELIDLLETAHSWLPTDVTTLENIVELCTKMIEGVGYRDPYENNTSKSVFLNPKFEQSVRERLDRAGGVLKQLKPGYTAPHPQATKPDACFVVTATMGDQRHPSVQLLRQFRSECLSRSAMGCALIDWYYRHGPAAARYVAKAKWRRTAALHLLVKPATLVAAQLLKRARGRG